MQFLNELFLVFDQLVDLHGVHKVLALACFEMPALSSHMGLSLIGLILALIYIILIHPSLRTTACCQTRQQGSTACAATCTVSHTQLDGGAGLKHPT